MKIWIVEEYDVEDSRNLAVCTSFEKAREFLDKCQAGNRYVDYSINEYVVNVWCWNPNSHAGKQSAEPEIRAIEVASA